MTRTLFTVALSYLSFCILEFPASAQCSTNLAQAVDTTNLCWTTGGNVNWIGTNAANSDTFDGVDTGRSGKPILRNQDSWIQTTVTGPGTLSFWWKASCCDPFVNDPGDFLEFYVDDDLQDMLTGITAWQFKSVNIPDGVTQTLKWRYAKGDHPGSCGSDIGLLDQVIFTTSAPLSLAKALDTCGVVWSNPGNTNFTYWTGQTSVTHDGADAVESGAITHNQESWMAMDVIGVTNVSFWWKVSSETNSDFLQFYSDATLLSSISGERGWLSNSFSITTNAHTLKWRYVKNPSDFNSKGLDRGWVDQVSFRPPLTNPVFPLTLTTPQSLPEGGVGISVESDEDCACRILCSTNFAAESWTVLTNFAPSAVKRLVDHSTTNSDQRYYQGVSP